MMILTREREEELNLLECKKIPLKRDTLLYLIRCARGLDRLLCHVNGVTAWHRHGNKVPEKKLTELCNVQIDVEEMIRDRPRTDSDGGTAECPDSGDGGGEPPSPAK